MNGKASKHLRMLRRVFKWTSSEYRRAKKEWNSLPWNLKKRSNVKAG